MPSLTSDADPAYKKDLSVFEDLIDLMSYHLVENVTSRRFQLAAVYSQFRLFDKVELGDGQHKGSLHCNTRSIRC